jgi:phosphonate degradation associated HDIG domain protein
MTMDIIDEIFSLFARYGDRGYGEDVNQREHALQAAYFASKDGASDALIAAALLHDIGQFIDGSGDAADFENRDARHEYNGAALLEGHFLEEVVAPIRLHVDAKRYLCAVEPDYEGALSRASLLSLRLQGGRFDKTEADAFAQRRFALEAVRVRRYDDLGKQIALTVPPLGSYRALLSTLRL